MDHNLNIILGQPLLDNIQLFSRGQNVRLDKFLDEFVDNLCSWTELTRTKYIAKGTNGGYGIVIGASGVKMTDATLQDSLRDVMNAIHSGTNEDFERFCEKIQARFSLTILNNEVDIFESICSILIWALSQNENFISATLIRMIRESGAFQELKHLTAAERNKLMNHDLLVLKELKYSLISLRLTI